MEMSGQPHVSAAIPTGEIASDIRRIGGYVGLTYERDASVRRNTLKMPKIELLISSRPTHRLFNRGEQIPCTRSAWLHFVRWYLVVMGPQYGTCFTSSFWRLKFWGIFYFLVNITPLLLTIQVDFPGFSSCTISKRKGSRRSASTAVVGTNTYFQPRKIKDSMKKPECIRRCCVQACLHSVTSHSVVVKDSCSKTFTAYTCVYNFPHLRSVSCLHLPSSPLDYVSL
jgi:hypothetical protein